MGDKRVQRLLFRIRRDSISEGIGPITRLEGSILMALSRIVCLKGNATIVDAGAGLGFSTAWLIMGSASLPSNMVRIDAVEYDSHRFEKLVRNIEELLSITGLERTRVNFVYDDAINYFRKTSFQYDLAFIDVEKHQYPDVLDILVDKLRTGGFAVFHNVIEPPPPPGFIEKLHGTPWVTTIIPTRRGLSVSIKLI